jgi:subtilase family serine protease
VLLRVLTVSGIPAGGTISNAITQTLPSGTGTGLYYIFLIADQGRAVAESNESNNTVKKAVTVY